MEELLHHLYRIGLPDGACAYLLCAEGRGLLIDCGPNTDEAEQTVLDAVSAAGLSPERTDVFLTHGHAGTAGLCARLKRPENRVFVRPCDGAYLNAARSEAFWEDQLALCAPMGVPQNRIPEFHDFSAYRERFSDPVDFTDVRDGDRLPLGGYRLECVELAGHTPGQLGLWDFEKGLLFGGDVLGGDETVCAWDRESDALRIGLRNLRKVRSMQLETVLPAHGAPVEQVLQRADAAAARHQAGCDAVCAALDAQPGLTVWELMQALDETDDFARLDGASRWDALRAVFAQTEYLRRCEKLSCDPRTDGWRYRVNH